MWPFLARAACARPVRKRPQWKRTQVVSLTNLQLCDTQGKWPLHTHQIYQASVQRHHSISDSALDAASCMSSLFLFARSFPFVRFHPLEYVLRLSKAEYDHVKQCRSVIL